VQRGSILCEIQIKLLTSWWCWLLWSSWKRSE